MATYKAKRAADINPSTSTATVFLNALAPTDAAVCVYIPAGTTKFKVRAAGTATGGTTTNFTPTLQIGNKTTAASNTNLAGLTARAVDSAEGAFAIEADCNWDSTSNTIRGMKDGWNGTTPTVETHAIFTSVTSQDLSVSGKAISINGLFSTANADNTATLDYLTLEVLERG